MDLRRKGSLDMLNFKLKKHKLKIQGIIKRYSDQVSEDGKDLVNIAHIKDIFNDFSYICAIVFCMQKEFKDTKQYMGIKESSQKF